MSLSPFKSSRQLSARPKNVPLSLSQALLITAGLAGLVGLSSGIVIRFSLSHSPHASFLSPLQTFPDLPNWTPEHPLGTADSQSLPDDTNTQRADSGEVNGTGAQSDRSYTEPKSPPATTLDPFVEQNRSNDLYTAPSAEPEANVYSEEPYSEEPYSEESYPEESYPENEYYPENYPAVEAPASGEASYYDSGQQ